MSRPPRPQSGPPEWHGYDWKIPSFSRTQHSSQRCSESWATSKSQQQKAASQLPDDLSVWFYGEDLASAKRAVARRQWEEMQRKLPAKVASQTAMGGAGGGGLPNAQTVSGAAKEDSDMAPPSLPVPEAAAPTEMLPVQLQQTAATPAAAQEQTAATATATNQAKAVIEPAAASSNSAQPKAAPIVSQTPKPTGWLSVRSRALEHGGGCRVEATVSEDDSAHGEEEEEQNEEQEGQQAGNQDQLAQQVLENVGKLEDRARCLPLDINVQKTFCQDSNSSNRGHPLDTNSTFDQGNNSSKRGPPGDIISAFDHDSRRGRRRPLDINVEGAAGLDVDGNSMTTTMMMSKSKAEDCEADVEDRPIHKKTKTAPNEGQPMTADASGQPQQQQQQQQQQNQQRNHITNELRHFSQVDQRTTSQSEARTETRMPMYTGMQHKAKRDKEDVLKLISAYRNHRQKSHKRGRAARGDYDDENEEDVAANDWLSATDAFADFPMLSPPRQKSPQKAGKSPRNVGKSPSATPASSRRSTSKSHKTAFPKSGLPDLNSDVDLSSKKGAKMHLQVATDGMNKSKNKNLHLELEGEGLKKHKTSHSEFDVDVDGSEVCRKLRRRSSGSSKGGADEGGVDLPDRGGHTSSTSVGTWLWAAHMR